MSASVSLAQQQLAKAVDANENLRLDSASLLAEVRSNPNALLDSGKALKMQRVIASDIDVLQRLQKSVDGFATTSGSDVDVAAQPVFSGGIDGQDDSDFWAAALRCLGHENPEVTAAALEAAATVLGSLFQTMMKATSEEDVQLISKVVEAATEAGFIAEACALPKFNKSTAAAAVGAHFSSSWSR